MKRPKFLKLVYLNCRNQALTPQVMPPGWQIAPGTRYMLGRSSLDQVGFDFGTVARRSDSNRSLTLYLSVSVNCLVRRSDKLVRATWLLQSLK